MKRYEADEFDDDFDDRPRRRRARPSKRAMNSLAIGALILGIASFCLGPLTGIPAVICGVFGLAAARQQRAGTGMAITGITLGSVLSVAVPVLLLPTVKKVREAAARSTDRAGDPAGLTEWAAARPHLVMFPELGAGREIQPGVRFHETTITRAATRMRLWYYRPAGAAGKLALVLVPPAGSTLASGMALGDGDRAEHYPYVAAGFAVASFDIDGDVPNRQGATEAALLRAAREFRDAQAGLANFRVALDFILAKVPDVDASRVYVAGHSSAATLALLAAEHEPRVAACAAFAPVTDVPARLAQAVPALNRALPGYRDFLRHSSPKAGVDRLRCPVFLFHAADDDNVPVSESKDFAVLLGKTNPRVTLVITPAGGHYDSMVREGVPKCIAWLKGLPNRP